MTRLEPCPQCRRPWPRPVATFGGREVFAAVAVLCPDCSANAPEPPSGAWQRAWQRMPEDYRRAVPERIPEALRPCLDWAPAIHPYGLGLIGESGAGKSCALACLVRKLRLQFRWLSGTEARQAHIDAATAQTGDGRGELWRSMQDCRILVLDDISQGKFSEAWGSALFGLLEARRSARRPTFWTSQKNLPELRAKITQGTNDSDQADAISRRLGDGSQQIHA